MTRRKSITETAAYERLSKRRKKFTSKEDRLMAGVDAWASYWRANPHRFAEDFLGIKLKLFQQILIYIMMHFDYFTYIAARGFWMEDKNGKKYF